MKLFKPTQEEELILERKKSLMIDDEPIKRPIGISAEEFTEDYKSRLADIKIRRPDLYKKIVNGH